MRFKTKKRQLKKRKNKTRKLKGGKKSKRIKDIIDVFKLYPDIFPRGYFRFLPGTLEKHEEKKTLQYTNGVVLTWTVYQKTVKKGKAVIKPGDVKINQLVNKNQGNGKAKKIFLDFLKKKGKNKTVWLEVRANNKRAIRFYKKNGFKKVTDITFGEKMKGILMVRK